VRLLPTSLAAVLAAALLAGCAGQATNDAADDYQGEKKAVAQVIDDLAAAGRDRDAKEICTSILAESVVDKLRQGKSDCQDALSDQLADASDFQLDVESIQVSGDTATAKVKAPVDGKDVVQTLTFQREGRTWRLAKLAAPAGS
jgi:ketosteroid isomerase-like protein